MGWIREARKAQGLTQQALAARTGIAQGTLSGLETGTRKPSVSTAKRLASELGVDWTKFFEDEMSDGVASG